MEQKFKKSKNKRTSQFESDLFQDRLEKGILNKYKDCEMTCQIRLKSRLNYHLNNYLEREDMELLCYIIYTNLD